MAQMQFDYTDFKNTKMSFTTMNLDDFPANGAPEMKSPPPTKELIDSVMAMGIQIPVCWISYDGATEFAAGRRRIKAARAAIEKIAQSYKDKGLEFPKEDYEYLRRVKSLIFVGPKTEARRAIGLIENFRSENQITDAAFIGELIDSGMQMEEIKLYTGKTKPQIQKLLQFADIGAPLVDGLNNGLISQNTAKQVTKLSPTNREKVLNKLADGKKVTGDDIAELKRTHSHEVAQAIQLPDMVIAPPSNAMLIRNALINAGFRPDDQGDIIVQVSGEKLTFSSIWDGGKITEPVLMGNNGQGKQA